MFFNKEFYAKIISGELINISACIIIIINIILLLFTVSNRLIFNFKPLKICFAFSQKFFFLIETCE